EFEHPPPTLAIALRSTSESKHSLKRVGRRGHTGKSFSEGRPTYCQITPLSTAQVDLAPGFPCNRAGLDNQPKKPRVLPSGSEGRSNVTPLLPSVSWGHKRSSKPPPNRRSGKARRRDTGAAEWRRTPLGPLRPGHGKPPDLRGS